MPQEELVPEACDYPCFQKLLTQTPDRRSSSQAGGNHLEGAELARAVWYSSSHFYQQVSTLVQCFVLNFRSDVFDCWHRGEGRQSEILNKNSVKLSVNFASTIL